MDCKFRKDDTKTSEKLYSLIKKIDKRQRKFEKCQRSADVSDSDSDRSWQKQQIGLGSTCKNVGFKKRRLNSSDKSNKLKSTDYNNVFQNLKCKLKDNLFVYNERSFPAKIRKHIRAKITHSPEVVAVIVLEKTVNGKLQREVKNLRVLLDSGVRQT